MCVCIFTVNLCICTSVPFLFFFCGLAHTLFLSGCIISSLHLNYVIWFRQGVTGRARHFLPLFEAEVHASQSAGCTRRTNLRSLGSQRAQMKTSLATPERAVISPHFVEKRVCEKVLKRAFQCSVGDVGFVLLHCRQADSCACVFMNARTVQLMV